MDKTLLRRILSAPISSPVCALYAELGCHPVRLLLQSKRINYLHYILTRKSDELVSKVFWVQKDVPVKNDYYSTVVRDLEYFGINRLTNLQAMPSKSSSSAFLEPSKSLSSSSSSSSFAFFSMLYWKQRNGNHLHFFSSSLY